MQPTEQESPKNHSRWIGLKGKQRQSPSQTKAQKEKGHTTEEASRPETVIPDSQWQVSVESPQHETWQVDDSSRNWTSETGWEEPEVHYQEWDNSQDWQFESSGIAVSLHTHESEVDTQSRASGMPCRVSGQVLGHLRLFVEDAAQESYLTTESS